MARFFLAHAETHTMPVVEEMQRQLRQLEAAFDGFRNQARMFEQHMSANQDRLASFEQALQSKMGNDQGQRLERQLENLKADFGEATRMRIEQEQCLLGRSDRLEEVFTDLSSRVATIGQSVRTGAERLQHAEAVIQQKVDASQVESLSNLASSIEGQMSRLEQDIHVGVEKMQLADNSIGTLSKQTAYLEQALQTKVDLKQMQQFEGLVVGIQGQVSQVEHALQDKATVNQLQNVKAAIATLEGKMADADQALQDKAGITQLHHLKTTLSCTETKLTSIEQALHDKVSSGQMQQLKSIVMGMQAQATSLEQNLHEKVGSDQVQQLKGALSGFQAQLTNTEQLLQEKAGMSHLQQMRTILSSIETKMSGAEQALQDKVDIAQIQQISDSVSNLQTKVAGIERGVWEGMDCVQAMEGALTGLKTQTSSVELLLQEKVSVGQMQQVCDTLMGMKQKVASMEQTVRAGADRVNDVEGAVISVGSQLATFKQALHDRFGASQGRMLTLELDRAERPPLPQRGGRQLENSPGRGPPR